MRRNWKKVLGLASILVVVALLAWSTAGLCAEAVQKDFKYVASQDGKRYHLPSCSLAKKIKPDKLVRFATVEEARKAGYTPCKRCNPPQTD